MRARMKILEKQVKSLNQQMRRGPAMIIPASLPARPVALARVSALWEVTVRNSLASQGSQDRSGQELKRGFHFPAPGPAKVIYHAEWSGPAEPDSRSDSRQASLIKGEQQLVRWCQDGTLVGLKELATSWGVTWQALQQAAKRGEIFLLRVSNKLYTLGDFKTLRRPDVKQVSEILRELDPSEQLIFWLRSHGGLGARTPVQALQAKELAKVLSIARGWAAENAAP